MKWLRFLQSNPGRELGEIAAAKRRREALTTQERIRIRTLEMRAELRLPPAPVLERR